MWFTALAMTGPVWAQKGLTVEEYIDRYKHISIEEMEKTGIPASITLAQGILESRYGNSTLAVASNNHFGIKCHKEWEGKRYYHDDDHKNECFRVYRDPEESFRDHSDFLLTRPRYAFLFEYEPTDYKNWAHGLKQAGYATNPKYGHILIDLIERHQLYVYDRPGKDAIVRRPHAERNQNQTVPGQGQYKPGGNKVTVPDGGLTAGSGSGIISYNRIKAVVVARYENVSLLAQRHGVPVDRIMKYNDLAPGQELREGSMLYLQPKRARSVRQRNHVVQRNETMWDISQLHGIKLSRLYQRNLLIPGEEPAPGAIISLNHKTDSKPALREPGQEDLPVTPPAEPATRQEVLAPTPQPAPASAPGNGQAQTATPASPQPASAQKETAVTEKPAPRPEAENWHRIHDVQKGDTLYSISRLYGVSVDDLKRWNNLADNIISIGQKLLVSP